VHGEEVIPKDRAKLLASGRASVKPMPKGDYYRLYQDHVCSAALRVAREFLALLPIDEVIVTATDDLVDPATGHLKKTAILSLRVPRETVEKLNFQALDPSDSLRNFLHRMSFGSTTGFPTGRAHRVFLSGRIEASIDCRLSPNALGGKPPAPVRREQGAVLRAPVRPAHLFA
jgi:hypothetical protein